MSEGKKMDFDEMMQFIANVGCSELFEELKALKLHHRSASEMNGSYYLKAVCSSLEALGYDDKWVMGEFRLMFEGYYGRLVDEDLISDGYCWSKRS